MPLPLAGARIRAADLADIFPQGVDAWTDYTPTLTQTATVTKNITAAKYTKIGRTLIGQASMTCTSAGTAGAQVRLGLPEVAVNTVTMVVGYIYDASTTTRYVVSGFWTGTNLGFVHDTSGGNVFGTAPAVTLASGDIIDVLFVAQTAS